MVIVIFFFMKKGSSGKTQVNVYPVNLGTDTKSTFKSKSKFGNELEIAAQQITDQFKNYIQRNLNITLNENNLNKMTKLFVQVMNSDSPTIGGINTSATTNEQRMKIAESLTPGQLSSFFQLVYIYLIVFGSQLQDVTKASMAAPESNVGASGMLQYIGYADLILNIDIKNDYKSVGNGWDQYAFNDITTTSNSENKIKNVINATNPNGASNEQFEYNTDTYIPTDKQIKFFMLYFDGSDQGSSGQIVVKLTGTDADGVPLDTYSNTLSYVNDRKNLNPVLFVPVIKYPIIVDDFKISVTTGGSEVSVKNLILLITYY